MKLPILAAIATALFVASMPAAVQAKTMTSTMGMKHHFTMMHRHRRGGRMAGSRTF